MRPLAGPSPPLLPDLPSPSLPAQGGEGMLNQCVGQPDYPQTSHRVLSRSAPGQHVTGNIEQSTPLRARP